MCYNAITIVPCNGIVICFSWWLHRLNEFLLLKTTIVARQSKNHQKEINGNNSRLCDGVAETVWCIGTFAQDITYELILYLYKKDETSIHRFTLCPHFGLSPFVLCASERPWHHLIFISLFIISCLSLSISIRRLSRASLLWSCLPLQSNLELFSTIVAILYRER